MLIPFTFQIAFSTSVTSLLAPLICLKEYEPCVGRLLLLYQIHFQLAREVVSDATCSMSS